MSQKIIKQIEEGIEDYYDKFIDVNKGQYSSFSNGEHWLQTPSFHETTQLNDSTIDDNEIHDPKNPKKGCTRKHPPLTFNFNNKIGTIFGSACANPIFEADLFISLDKDAPVFDWEQPWTENTLNQKHIRYFIEDFSIPDDAQDFDDCVNFALDTMSKGKTAHVGCLSGHGRTGMFLSALTQKIIGEQLKKDNISAIDYVRDNYCAKSVETLEQILFLYANYDIDIPNKQKQDVIFIKEEFKKNIGVSLDKVIELGEYDACVEVIKDLENILISKNKTNSNITPIDEKFETRQIDKNFFSNGPNKIKPI